MAPFPYMPMLALLATLVSYLVVQMNVFAYAGFMVEYLGVVDDTDKSGYYAGVLTSAFMLGLACSSHFWGLVSDRLGPRFVLVVGLTSTVLLSIAFGLSNSFAMAFICRFLMGLMNGMMAASKTLVSELCGKEHETVGMGVVTTSSTIGVVLGPGVGGVLAEPARHHPETFSESGIFGRFPYLLPNLVGAGLALLAVPLVLIFIEDGASHVRSRRRRDEDGLEFPQKGVPVENDDQKGVASPPPCRLEDGRNSSHTPPLDRAKSWLVSWWRDNSGGPGDEHEKDNRAADISEAGEVSGAKEDGAEPGKAVGTRKGRLAKAETGPVFARGNSWVEETAKEGLRNSTGDLIKPASLLDQHHIRILLIIFGLYSFSYSGFDEVYTLWSLSSVGKGGLDWSTLQIGQAFLVCGLLILVFELLAVPYLTPRLGVRMSHRIGSICEMPVYLLIPMLSRISSRDVPSTVGSLILLFTVNVCTNSFYVGMSIAINNATGPERRGELNGLSMMVSSFAKALAPVACSALFAFSIDGDHPFPFDYHLVFYLLGALRLTVALMGWYRITGAASEETRSLMLDE